MARMMLLIVCVAVLASCALIRGDDRVTVSKIDGGYRVATAVEGLLFVSTNSGQTITDWQPRSACVYDSNYTDRRTIVCKAPVEIAVYTAGSLGWQLVTR